MGPQPAQTGRVTAPIFNRRLLGFHPQLAHGCKAAHSSMQLTQCHQAFSLDWALYTLPGWYRSHLAVGDISTAVVTVAQVKEQTLREREQAELRLQEAHQAEQNALAHLHSMRKDCRYLYLLPRQRAFCCQERPTFTSTFTCCPFAMLLHRRQRSGCPAIGGLYSMSQAARNEVA